MIKVSTSGKRKMPTFFVIFFMNFKMRQNDTFRKSSVNNFTGFRGTMSEQSNGSQFKVIDPRTPSLFYKTGLPSAGKTVIHTFNSTVIQ